MVTKKEKVSRPRHDTPIGIVGTVDELPPRQYSSAANEVLEAIKAADGKWIELDPSGRQASSVQSMIDSAAKRDGISVSVSVRGGRVFAKVNKASK